MIGTAALLFCFIEITASFLCLFHQLT